jgi:hypothetical protein
MRDARVGKNAAIVAFTFCARRAAQPGIDDMVLKTDGIVSLKREPVAARASLTL